MPEQRGKLSGIIPPIATPLTADERIDEVGMRRIVAHLLDNGVDALFANGSMGAFALLSDSEQFRAVEIVLDEVRGRVPVLAGAADTGTRRVIEKARQMSALGADYITILPPFYYELDEKSISRFYRDVAEAVPAPIFIYNNPVRTGFYIPLGVIYELSEVPNIVGIKESNQNRDHWQRLINRFREDSGFSVLIGTEELVKIALLMGADGIVAGLHNLAPGQAVALYHAVKAGDLERADELQMRLTQLCRVITEDNLWGRFESALQTLRICEKVTASPYCSLVNHAERERVAAALKECLADGRLRGQGDGA